MTVGDPSAYFLTWTTYGAWLPGDARGWVHHADAAPGAPYHAADAARENHARSLMKHEAVALNAHQRRMVEEAIQDTCRVRTWRVHALNVRSNHVHVVLTAPARTPEQVMVSLKAWASQRLNAVYGKRRWWTRHGSTRYVKTSASLQRAIEYVRNQ